MFNEINQALNDIVWQWHEHNVINNRNISLEHLIDNSNLDAETRAALLEKISTPIDELINARSKSPGITK